LIAGELGKEFARAAFGDGAQMLDHLVAAHSHAVVGDRDGAGCLVIGHLDTEIRIGLQQIRLRNRLETQLVARVGCVADQLTQENFLVAV
jgi:hypothetical protein